MWLATTARAYAAYMLLFLILVVDSDQYQILRSCTLTLAAILMRAWLCMVMYPTNVITRKCRTLWGRA